MMATTEPYRQYRAPAANNTALVDPPWADQLARLSAAPAYLEGNRGEIKLGDVALAKLARAAREELLAQATRYTGRYTDTAEITRGPLVVSGHQPELFHPGVWFKNFALDALAKASGGVGVHLLIDSDLCRATSVRTPTGSTDEPRLEPVAYDQTTPAVPHEERHVLDRDTFATFAERATERVAPFISEPLVGELWGLAQPALERGEGLAAVLSEARHRLERRWGATTLELPFSQACDTEGFRRLAAELLVRHEEARDAYNGALDDYRAAHRLKNAAQPLPDLATHDGWTESPLWVWSEADPTRRAVWVRRRDGGLTLSDGAAWRSDAPADADGLVACLADLRAAGVKVRSRALVTTLYCRLVLADQFLHGIGGAKYDQVTDRFAERLLGVAPPAHTTLTATLRLPIDHQTPTEEDRRSAQRRLRDLRYHPERFTPDHEAAAEKRRWVGVEKTPDNAAERHAAITAANRAMAETLADERVATEQRLAAIGRGRRAAAVLDSREHSFCLFPAEDIRHRLARLARVDNAG